MGLFQRHLQEGLFGFRVVGSLLLNKLSLILGSIMCKKIIEVSQEYFIKHLLERLKAINENLTIVDDGLYNNGLFHDEWQKIRDSNLELDDIINAIDN